GTWAGPGWGAAQTGGGARGEGSRLAPNPARAKRPPRRRNPGADPAEPDDQQRLAAKLVLALAGIGDHAAPVPPALVVAPGRNVPHHRENERHRVFRDRPLVDALGARQTDALRAQHIARELIGPRPDRLNEPQLGGALYQPVAPQAGDDENVGLGNARGQIIEAAHLDRAQPGVARGKAIAQAIGHMGETDREVGAIGKRTCRHGIYSTNKATFRTSCRRSEPAPQSYAIAPGVLSGAIARSNRSRNSDGFF